MKNVLTIAGSDSSGGAGIQADLKTFSAHGVFGMSVITAVTAQNTQGVFAIQDIDADVIRKQIEAIFEDIAVDAVKIGMVSRVETILAVAEGLRRYRPPNVVLDPVMVSKSGAALLNPDARQALVRELLPISAMVTPNIPEAETIAQIRIDGRDGMEAAARIIAKTGSGSVLVKGGHLSGTATDILFSEGKFRYFESERIPTRNTHGTGCTLSSAIAANLALGSDSGTAVERAKDYITTAIRHAFSIGKGVGPVHHFYALYEKAGLL